MPGRNHKRKVRSFFLEGRAGRLEAFLNGGAENAAGAALVCHPHPLYGGTMNNRVVFHTMKALNGCGLPVLRFNFRGTGLSAGEHDFGRGEIEDVRTALEWLYAEFRLPIVLAGFSFGAAVGLQAASPDPRVRALIAIGAPLEAEGRKYEYDFLRTCRKPKLFLSGSCDEYASPAGLEELMGSLPDPKQLILFEGAGHMLGGYEDELRRKIEEWVKTLPAGVLA
jgi:hypothetical protein